jgi:hypothetical protein
VPSQPAGSGIPAPRSGTPTTDAPAVNLGDEVEVTFSSDEDRALQLEAEIDDGRLAIDVCER